MSYVLSLLKTHLTLHLYSHTHTSIHLTSKHSIMVLAKHIHNVHKSYHAYHPNQMHVHVIMHDLPHLPHSTTAPMYQCMFM